MLSGNVNLKNKKCKQTLVLQVCLVASFLFFKNMRCWCWQNDSLVFNNIDLQHIPIIFHDFAAREAPNHQTQDDWGTWACTDAEFVPEEQDDTAAAEAFWGSNATPSINAARPAEHGAPKIAKLVYQLITVGPHPAWCWIFCVSVEQGHLATEPPGLKELAVATCQWHWPWWAIMMFSWSPLLKYFFFTIAMRHSWMSKGWRTSPCAGPSGHLDCPSDVVWGTLVALNSRQWNYNCCN